MNIVDVWTFKSQHFCTNVLLKSFILRIFVTKEANHELNNYSHLYFKQNIALIFVAQRQKRCGQKIKRLKSPLKFVSDLSCTMRNKVRHYRLSFYYFDALINILCYSRFLLWYSKDIQWYYNDILIDILSQNFIL